MNDNQAKEQQHLPAEVQPVRDESGKFAPGNPATYGQPFTPGMSGNPTGRPAGVTYPGDWMRRLLGRTEADLKQIADDDTEPISKRSVARMLLDTIDTSPEVRGRAAIRVMDRTEGKPTQRIAARIEDRRSGAEIAVQLMADARKRMPLALPGDLRDDLKP
jgi:hypothetical protein